VRRSVVVFGVAVAVVGAGLCFVPLVSTSSHISIPVGDGYRFGITGALLFATIPFTASWTAGTDANVTVYDCGTNPACPKQVQYPVVAHGLGARGSMGWSGKAGEEYLLVPSADSNVTVTYVEPVSSGLLGVGVVGLGVLVLLLGVVLVRRPPVPSVPAPTERPA
jgi:hypothetical protein